MASDSRKRRPVESLITEWDVLYSLLRGQHQHPFPSDEDIKSFIYKTETDLSRCDEEIQRLQAQIIALENEKRLIERNAFGYKSLLAPIRKLPLELLQQIFLLVCDENCIADSVHIPPATLSQVCSSWRDLATSSPRLWSTITLIVDETVSSPNAETVLRHLLEQSGSAPLDISIEIDDAAASSDLLNMLVRQSCRWLRLSLHMFYQLFNDVRSALRPIQGNLPLLEHLELNVGPQEGRALDVFQDAPRLRSVKLLHESSPDLIVLPWEQLQSLVLWGACHNASLQRLSSRLKTITIDNCFRDGPEPFVKTVLDATAFSLGLEYSDDTDIIADLTLPKLTSLSMFSETSASLSDISPIRSLISRSSCVLTSLTWSNLPTPLEPFLFFLSTVPSLTNLSLSDASERSPVIAHSLFNKFQNHFSFSKFSSISIFLPNLQTLSLSSKIEELCFSDAGFVDVVTSRWLPNASTQCLRSVRLETPKRCFTANLIPLQQLARAGMKIVIKDKTGIVLC